MYLEIKIELDNAAFVLEPTGGLNTQQLQSLLRGVGVRIGQGVTSGKVQDVNGNTCGRFRLVKEN